MATSLAEVISSALTETVEDPAEEIDDLVNWFSLLPKQPYQIWFLGLLAFSTDFGGFLHKTGHKWSL
jgi:hypothetical protein